MMTDYEAMYCQSQEELESAKKEIEILKDQNTTLHHKVYEFGVIKQTLEFILGRKFYDD